MKHVALSTKLGHGVSRTLHYYADWRIGATAAEKRCHKQSDSILLTFDDYGDRGQITAILNVLAQEKVKAMFFLESRWAEAHPELLALIQSAGHVVGNHTYSHPNLLKLSDEAIEAEIKQGLASQWLRAPMGRYNTRVRALANRLGYHMCYWTIDSRDWKGTPEATMRHTIQSELAPGAVILFHVHGRHTAAALPAIIGDIRAAGYHLTAPAEDWAPQGAGDLTGAYALEAKA
jgi:peptidoglycan/xylan/chitin deacetylase (PgdA/CDA1 family)